MVVWKLWDVFLPLGNQLNCVYVSICLSSSFLPNSLSLIHSLSPLLFHNIFEKKNPSPPPPLPPSPIPSYLSHCLCILSPKNTISLSISLPRCSSLPLHFFLTRTGHSWLKTIMAQHNVCRSIRMIEQTQRFESYCQAVRVLACRNFVEWF